MYIVSAVALTTVCLLSFGYLDNGLLLNFSIHQTHVDPSLFGLRSSIQTLGHYAGYHGLTRPIVSNNYIIMT